MGSVPIVSKKFRDVLMEFDIGTTRLIELSVYKDDKEAPSTCEPHYYLELNEQKDAFLPEYSEKVKVVATATELFPDRPTIWRNVDNEDDLAVSADCDTGVDFAMDSHVVERIFMTDRLKRAFDAAGVKSRAFTPIKARVFRALS